MESTRKFKTILTSFVICCLLVTNILTTIPVYAAEGILSLKTTAERVEQGDTFDVTLGYDGKFVGVEIDVQFDADMLELVASTSGVNGGVYTEPVDLEGATGKQVVNINGSNINGQFAKDGILLKMTFKAKEEVKGTAAFEIINKGFYNLDSDYNEVNIDYTEDNQLKNGIVILAPPTDISVLTSKLTEARGYLEAEHTATSFAALKAAITEAEKITTENTKEEVQAQVDALQKAIDGLKKAVDKAVLKTALEAVPKDLDVYTPETANAVRSAQVEAQALLDNADLEDSEENQAAVKAAADKLNEAVKALQALPQKDVLANKIKEAEAKLADGNAYMTADREAVEVALKAAKTINDDENATEAEVSKAIADLDKAVSALRIKADRAAFDEALAQVKNNFIEENYTTGSWKVYQPALAKAEELSQKMTSEEIAQSEADSILEALQTASKGLVPVATAEEKATMEKAIADAEALKAENYTKASYEKVTEAIKAAQALDLKDSSSETVKAATEAIHTAVKGLVTVVEDQDSGIVVEGLEAGTGFEVTDQSKDKDVLTGIEESVKKDPTFADAEKTEVVFAGSIKPEVAPDGSAVVKIPVAKAQQGYQAYFYGLRNADGSYTWKKAELKDGMIVFSADSFGEFAVIGANFPAPQEPAVPGTGTTVNGQGTSAKGNAATGLQNESAGLMIAGLLIVAAAGFAGYRKKMTR